MPQVGVFVAQAAAALSSVIGITATNLLFQLAGVYVLNRVGSLLSPRRAVSSPDAVRELAQSTTLPPYRFVYGHTRVYGSPAPWRVKGTILYGCLILNSRPSQGNFTIYFDKRPIALSGDLYDLSGLGAVATEAPFLGWVTCWIGTGDQTGPPAPILGEVPELFQATDGWQGRTVLWVRLDIGPTTSRNERWPRTPPEIEVEGDWSLVFDPREAGHDLDDPSTWSFSDNQALCVLDALTQNPVKAYREMNLLMDSFSDAADVADETVALKSGGSEARYRVSGVLIWSEAEIEDQVEPMMVAGASQFTRVGGRLGILPGAYRAPSYTLDDVLAPGIEFQSLKRGRDLPTRVTSSYTSQGRGYESAQLQPWDIPGAATADGGVPSTLDLRFDMVLSPTQAMRLRKILGLRARRQRSLSCIAPPAAFDLIGGNAVTVDLPAPRSALDGIYELASLHPGVSPVGDDGGVALRCPMTLIETSASIYDWDGATEEEDIVAEDFDATRAGIGLPGAISAQTGAAYDLVTGGGTVPRIRFAFDPSPSASVTEYWWQWRIHDEDWQDGGAISTTTIGGDGKLYGFLNAAGANIPHDIRVQARVGAEASGWRTIENVTIGLSLANTAAANGMGSVAFSFDTPDSSIFQGVRIYSAAVGEDFANASLLVDLTTYAPGAAGQALVAGATDTVNLFTNSGFDTATDWTTPGGWSISGGKATHATGSGATLSQSVSVDEAATCRWALTMSDRTDGYCRARINGATDDESDPLETNEAHFGVLTAPASATSAGAFGNSTFDGSVDEFYLFEQTPDCLPQGAADYWIVPVDQTGANAAPQGPFTAIAY